MSTLFNDTTRIRLQTHRPSLANIFSHEAPSLGEGRRIRFISAASINATKARPTEPPPPPPPVAEVLRPVVPPKKFVPPLTQNEVERINNVINHVPTTSNNSSGNDEDDTDCFSSDEFSDGDDDDNNNFRHHHRFQLPGRSSHDDEVDDDNLYDVAEYIENPKESSPPTTDSAISSQSDSNASSSETYQESSNSSSSSSGVMDDGVENSNSPRRVKYPLDLTVTSGHMIDLMNGNKKDNSNIKQSSSKDSENIKSSSTHSQVMISSSSWINLQDDSENPYGECSSLSEPVKPPRLKKLARLQKQEQERKHSGNKFYESGGGGMRRLSQQKKSRPEISAPVLLATTFNPNDAEAHKQLLAASQSTHRKSVPATSSDSDKISFKELKRLSSLFSSLSNLQAPSSFSSSHKENLSGSLKSLTGSRSSFYVAEAIYEEAASRQTSPLSDHIYEEIPEREETSLATSRPLPPIPESKSPTGSGSQGAKRERRGGSIFEGASKYEILHYLRDAKDRIGHSDFEIDLADERGGSGDAEEQSGMPSGFIGKRNHTHRVSAISNSSESSQSSVDSAASSSCEGSILLRGPMDRLVGSGVDIERTDSGVGSESSCDRKASFENKKAFVRANYHRKCRGDISDHLEDCDKSSRCFDCDICLEEPEKQDQT